MSSLGLATLLREHGDAPALLFGGASVATHRMLAELIDRNGHALRDHGIGPNTRVAVNAPRSPQLALAQLALIEHACCVPANPESTTRELDTLFDALGCAWLLGLPGTPAWRLAETRGMGRIELSLDDDRALFTQFAAPGREFCDPEPAALILQTSGSTAQPKNVALTGEQLRLSGSNVARSLLLTSDDRALHMMPMFHIGAIVDLMLAPLQSGGSVAFADSVSTRSFFKATTAHRPTWLQAVPTMLRDIARSTRQEGRQADLGSYRLVRSVSSSLPDALAKETRELFDCPVIQIYGMTETAGVITSQRVDQGSAHDVGRSVGPELSIRSELGKPLPPGEVGEVWVRGETVIQAYACGESPDSFHDGWLRTGDTGSLDAHGTLKLHGRIKDIINRGGEKIAPLEIDLLAQEHASVRDAAAFGIPHPGLGEDVALALVFKEGTTGTTDAVMDFLRTRLAPHKVPRRVLALDALPLGRTGKVQRNALSKLLAEQSQPTPAAQGASSPDRETLASMWRRLLDKQDVAAGDNFFDLGGDSLTAMEFVTELEEATGIRISPAELHRNPTLESFANHLQELDPGAAPNDSAADLPPDVYRELADVMASWRGEREGPDALLVARNREGPKLPLFWGVQGVDAFENLAQQLAPDQPVFGFRSLFRLSCKSVENSRRLARHFARELQAIQRGKPYILGGFCSGGELAFEMATMLEAQGVPPVLLVLFDSRPTSHYAGDCALFLSRCEYYRGAAGFADAALSLKKNVQGVRIERRVAVRRADALRSHKALEFTEALRPVLEAAGSGTLEALQARGPAWDCLPAEARRARIEVGPLSAAFGPGSSHRVAAGVTNRSRQAWQPGHGLVLGASFRKLRKDNTQELRNYRNRPLAGHVALDRTVAPGETWEADLAFRAPWDPGAYRLDIDMIDDGVAWFSDGDSESFQYETAVRFGAWLRFGTITRTRSTGTPR